MTVLSECVYTTAITAEYGEAVTKRKICKNRANTVAQLLNANLQGQLLPTHTVSK